MNTRTILAGIFLATLGLPALGQQAQTSRRAVINARGDSVVIRKGEGDLRIRIYEEQAENGEAPEEVEIYEGIYLERADETTNSFLEALPFIPKKKKKRDAYEPHDFNLYIGYAYMADHFMGFGESKHFPQDFSRSWEFGFNFLSMCHSFKKNPHWGVNIGAGWGYRSFNIDGNVALLKENGQAVFSAGDANSSYSRSRLRHFFFRIPVTVEWQQRLSTRRLVFFNLGPEVEIRHGVKSFTHINGGKKTRVGKGMYVNPIGISLLAQVGYGGLGFYLRYNTYSFFQSGKGPDVAPLSFGIAWHR